MSPCRPRPIPHTVAIALVAALVILGGAPRRAHASPDADGSRERSAPAPYVVGGTPVPEGKWLDAAAVYFSDGEAGCTGVLVAPDVVLTAGHCADGSITQVKLAANDLDDPGEVIAVRQQIPYGNYWSTYDIAVLLLASESSVEPRVITTGCIRDRYLVDGAPVAVVGYGAVDSHATDYPGVLMEGFTTITDHDCSSASGCNSSLWPDGELGAGGSGVDACNGDSGGPLYLLTERGDYLVGTTARAYDDFTLPCSQGGIYTRPDAVIDWIEAQSGRELPRAACNLAPVPTADPVTVEVEPGASVETAIAPNDPDADDSHVFEVGRDGEHGGVTVSTGGVARYTADAAYEGEDSFVIAVTDDGDPNLTGTVEVLVTVVPGAGCGCRSSGDGGSNGLLAALVVLGLAAGRRRRRS